MNLQIFVLLNGLSNELAYISYRYVSSWGSTVANENKSIDKLAFAFVEFYFPEEHGKGVQLAPLIRVFIFLFSIFDYVQAPASGNQ